jgi:hypothetical protein
MNAGLNGGGLLQNTVSPMGDMVHFYVITFAQHLLPSTGLTSIYHLLYSCREMAATSLMAPFQGQGQRLRLYYGQSRLSTKPLFFE